MATLRTWMRYGVAKFHASLDLAARMYEEGTLPPEDLFRKVFKNVFCGRLSRLHSYKGEEMFPTISSGSATLVIRPAVGLMDSQFYVGDVILFKHEDKMLVRRIIGKEGYELISTDSNDKPFDLERGCFWVIADNKNLDPKDAVDSRTFGPLKAENISGRAMYYYASQDNHGCIKNSLKAEELDYPLLAAELDLKLLSDVVKSQGV